MGCAASVSQPPSTTTTQKKPGFWGRRGASESRPARRRPLAHLHENHEIDASPTPERPPRRGGDRGLRIDAGGANLTGPSPNEYRETGMAETPVGRQADEFRHFCPLCFVHFRDVYELPCCRQSACAGCLGDFYKRPVGEGVIPGGARCLHCNTVAARSQFLRQLTRADEPKTHADDSPARRRSFAAATAAAASTSAVPYSPLKVGDDHEAMARKMLPFTSMMLTCEEETSRELSAADAALAEAAAASIAAEVITSARGVGSSEEAAASGTPPGNLVQPITIDNGSVETPLSIAPDSPAAETPADEAPEEGEATPVEAAAPEEEEPAESAPVSPVEVAETSVSELVLESIDSPGAAEAPAGAEPTVPASADADSTAGASGGASPTPAESNDEATPEAAGEAAEAPAAAEAAAAPTEASGEAAAAPAAAAP